MICFKCDDCKRPLDIPPLIDIQGIMFVETNQQESRGAKGLHFCGKDCMISFLTKLANKPNIVQLHAN